MYVFPNKVSYSKAIFFKLIRKFYSFVIRWRWLSYYNTVSFDLGYCGQNLTLCNGISFGGTERIFINDNVFIGENVILNAGKGGRIDISDEVAIGSNSTFITWSYGNYNNTEIERHLAKKKTIVNDISISAGVDIGYNVTINPGVRLGEGCIVNAGAVVSGTFAPFTIIAGNPAVIVGVRAAG